MKGFKTRFLDEINSIKVELIDWPDKKRIEKVLVDIIYANEEVEVYKKLTKEQKKNAINLLLKEGVLPKGIEMINFTFLVKNISLLITHCWVRHKFFSIMQRSTQVSDLRNENILVPRSFARNKFFYDRYKEWVLQGKELFCEAIDELNISVQNARVLIPKNNCNWMYMHMNLLALKDAIGKRLDDQEEHIQNNIICEKMIKLVIKKFPYLEDFFKKDCETGKCLHSKPGEFSNIVFKRNELHKKFLPRDCNIDNERTLHNFTRDEMNNGPEIKTEKYKDFDKEK